MTNGVITMMLKFLYSFIYDLKWKKWEARQNDRPVHLIGASGWSKHANEHELSNLRMIHRTLDTCMLCWMCKCLEGMTKRQVNGIRRVGKDRYIDSWIWRCGDRYILTSKTIHYKMSNTISKLSATSLGICIQGSMFPSNNHEMPHMHNGNFHWP